MILLSRLHGVRPIGENRWIARCPAHDDKSPSLAITDTGERILIHCFSGCEPSDILTAVGLEWSDLYPDKWDCARLRPNEGAAKYAKRFNQMDVEREIIRLAEGQTLSMEDQARVNIAKLRVSEND